MKWMSGSDKGYTVPTIGCLDKTTAHVKRDGKYNTLEDKYGKKIPGDFTKNIHLIKCSCKSRHLVLGIVNVSK